MQPTSRTLLALGLLAVLIAACGQAATPATVPTVAPASPPAILTSTPAPTITTAPALTVGEAETLVAQIKPTLTPRPGDLYPIWWTVSPYTTADGGTAYMVDYPEVLKKVKDDYVSLYIYGSYLSGLPEKVELETTVNRLLVPEAAQLYVAKVEDWRSTYGGYWRRTIPANWGWSDETAEFSADGSQVTLNLQSEEGDVKGEWIDLKTGQVTKTQLLPAKLVVITMRYNPEFQLWQLVSTQEFKLENGTPVAP